MLTASICILAEDAPTLRVEIGKKQRELADIDKAIEVLLDLAEKFGAASAGARLLELEREYPVCELDHSLRPNLVPRPHLIGRLDEGLHLGHRLSLVSAPAGFGETTLVTE